MAVLLPLSAERVSAIATGFGVGVVELESAAFHAVQEGHRHPVEQGRARRVDKYLKTADLQHDVRVPGQGRFAVGGDRDEPPPTDAETAW